jgi:hypothetical protein
MTVNLEMLSQTIIEVARHEDLVLRRVGKGIFIVNPIDCTITACIQCQNPSRLSPSMFLGLLCSVLGNLKRPTECTGSFLLRLAGHHLSHYLPVSGPVMMAFFM